MDRGRNSAILPVPIVLRLAHTTVIPQDFHHLVGIRGTQPIIKPPAALCQRLGPLSKSVVLKVEQCSVRRCFKTAAGLPPQVASSRFKSLLAWCFRSRAMFVLLRRCAGTGGGSSCRRASVVRRAGAGKTDDDGHDVGTQPRGPELRHSRTEATTAS